MTIVSYCFQISDSETILVLTPTLLVEWHGPVVIIILSALSGAVRYNHARGANIKLDMVVRFSVCKSTNPSHYTPTDRWTNKGDSKRAGNQRSKQALAQAGKNGQTRTRNNILVFACMCIYLHLNIS